MREQTDRNRRIMIMRKAGKSYSEIGEYFGISGARVHQIVNRTDGKEGKMGENGDERPRPV
jgi:DNA-directed RNA polymerase specialized sigma subunit